MSRLALVALALLIAVLSARRKLPTGDLALKSRP